MQANLTAAEREILRALAARAGTSQSAYLRRLIAEQLRADAVEAERVQQSESFVARLTEEPADERAAA